MTASLATRLVEPDYWTCPHGDRARPEPFQTYGPLVAEVCARAGFAPTPAQELGLDLIFAIRPDGSPASFAFCVICFRQTMKTGLFKQAVLGWVYVTEVDTVAWSAHELTTTTQAQRDLEELIVTTPMLSRRLPTGPNHGVYYGNREQRIEFATGQQILFKARTETGSRGLARRKLILDEAFALTAGMSGSVIPTVNAMSDAQVLYGSSAGKADSEVLHDLRDRGRNGKSPRLTYLEWEVPREVCSDPRCRHPKDAAARGLDCALDRPRLREIAVAPSAGRITLEKLDDVRQELPPEEFARECFGWWEESLSLAEVIPMAKWRELGAPGPERGVRPTALGLAASTERLFAVAACWQLSDTDAHVEEVLGDTFDSLAVVDWIAERARRRMPVVVAGDDPAASLAAPLKARGVLVFITGPAEMGRACGLFYDEVMAGRVTHGLENLEAGIVDGIGVALAVAKKRPIRDAGAWTWDRRAEEGNIAPLVAATLARYGAARHPRRNREGGTPTKPRDTHRRAVVL